MRLIVAAACAAIFAVAGTALLAAVGMVVSLGWGLPAFRVTAKQPVQIEPGSEAGKLFDETRHLVWLYEASGTCSKGKFGEARRILDQAEGHWPEWSSEYRAAYLFLRTVVFVELLKSERDPETIRGLRDEIELVSTNLLAFLISMDDESNSDLKWNTGFAVKIHAARQYAKAYPNSASPNFEDPVHR